MKVKQVEPTLFDTTIDVYEYLLVISLPQAVVNDVKRYKHLVSNLCGRFDSQFSTAHITIANIFIPIEREAGLLEQIKETAKVHTKFKLSLQNFAAFENTRTIYLNPVKKEPILAITKTAVNKIIYGKVISKKKQLVYWKNPHLTIAKKLNPIQFKIAWQEFSKMKYQASFDVDCLTLLKRDENWNYKKFKEFKLKA